MGTRLDPHTLRVYVVTSGTLVPGRGHREIAAAAIEGGATAIQLRAPELDDVALLPIAREIVDACRDAGVLCIVNDRVGVAMLAGADGVHVGQGDAPEAARASLGPDRVLGISVRDADQARAAAAAGADYLGVTVWSTATKPEAVARGLDGLSTVAGVSPLPVVGIGGIDATNAAEVIHAGAAGVAVISAVVAATEPVTATRALRDAVDRTLGLEGTG
ncbi:MAG: thiamine phosphate synthase [Actinomycetota bacterium]